MERIAYARPKYKMQRVFKPLRGRLQKRIAFLQSQGIPTPSADRLALKITGAAR